MDREAGFKQRKIALRNNATGEVRIILEDEHPDYPWTGGPGFNWSEGNYACDCNRALFFSRAVGEEPAEEHPCGDTAYTALWVEHSNGVREDMGEEDDDR